VQVHLAPTASALGLDIPGGRRDSSDHGPPQHRRCQARHQAPRGPPPPPPHDYRDGGCSGSNIESGPKLVPGGGEDEHLGVANFVGSGVSSLLDRGAREGGVDADLELEAPRRPRLHLRNREARKRKRPSPIAAAAVSDKASGCPGSELNRL